MPAAATTALSKDEAAQRRRIGRAKLVHATVKTAAEDYFRDMDGGIELSPAERDGRIMWLVWTGGNDHFWDGMVSPPSARSTC